MAKFKFASLSLVFLSVLSSFGPSSALASVVQRAPLLPTDADPTPICRSPRVLCGEICCQADYICSKTIVCTKKPPPPLPGNFSLSWSPDRLGHPNIIVLHGSGFAQGAAVSILEDWVTYIDGDPNRPEYHESPVWSHDFSDVSDFTYSTGIQDCSKPGSPGGGAYGQPATIMVVDWALGKRT
ncbi:hypothetical protein C8A05DRAFT_39572, partial [Staphylotrichum tortipilum]